MKKNNSDWRKEWNINKENFRGNQNNLWNNLEKVENLISWKKEIQKKLYLMLINKIQTQIKISIALKSLILVLNFSVKKVKMIYTRNKKLLSWG